MLQRARATRWRWSTPVGVLLLVAATSTALPVARWGDSALVLAVIPAAIAGYLAVAGCPRSHRRCSASPS